MTYLTLALFLVVWPLLWGLSLLFRGAKEDE